MNIINIKKHHVVIFATVYTVYISILIINPLYIIENDECCMLNSKKVVFIGWVESWIVISAEVDHCLRTWEALRNPRNESREEPNDKRHFDLSGKSR